MDRDSSDRPFSLEPMRESDLPIVTTIEQASFSTPWQTHDFERAMAQRGSLCRVARQASTILGYAVGYRVDGEYHLTDLAVDPDHRGEGTGGLLIDAMLEELSGLGVQVVTLEVRASNGAATGLYRSRGFETVAIRRDYYRRPREDAVVMIKPIEGSLSDWVAKRDASGDIS